MHLREGGVFECMCREADAGLLAVFGRFGDVGLRGGVLYLLEFDFEFDFAGAVAGRLGDRCSAVVGVVSQCSIPLVISAPVPVPVPAISAAAPSRCIGGEKRFYKRQVENVRVIALGAKKRQVVSGAVGGEEERSNL